MAASSASAALARSPSCFQVGSLTECWAGRGEAVHAYRRVRELVAEDACQPDDAGPRGAVGDLSARSSKAGCRGGTDEGAAAFAQRGGARDPVVLGDGLGAERDLWLGCQAAARRFISQRAAERIVCVASISGVPGLRSGPPTASPRASSTSYTQSRSNSVRARSTSPRSPADLIATPMTHSTFSDPSTRAEPRRNVPAFSTGIRSSAASRSTATKIGPATAGSVTSQGSNTTASPRRAQLVRGAFGLLIEPARGALSGEIAAQRLGPLLGQAQCDRAGDAR